MPIYIVLVKVGTLLEWADGLQSKMLDWRTFDGYSSDCYVTRAPAVLRIKEYIVLVVSSSSEGWLCFYVSTKT